MSIMRNTHEERSIISNQRRPRLISLSLALLILLAGCGRGNINAAPTRTLPTSIPAPTPLAPLPTVPPMGSQQNPILLTIVVPNTSAVGDSAQALSQAMSSEAGLTVEIRLVEAYHDSYKALCDRAATLATLDAFSYLGESEQKCGEAAYVLQQNGSTQTQGQFLARDVFLPQSYRGVFCRPDGESLNGWIIPTLTLRGRGVDPFTDLYSIIDAGSDEEVVRMIDAGACTLGATSVGAEQQVNGLEHPERLHVLEQLTPVPNDVVVLSLLVDQSFLPRISDLIADHTEELANLMGGEALVPITDDQFTDLRTLLSKAGVNPAAMGQ